MSSWAKDYGDLVYDETHILVTRDAYERMNGYESIGQPTSPSAGRIYRTNARGGTRPAPEGLVVIVEPDPEPGWVRRVGRVPLFIEEES